MRLAIASMLVSALVNLPAQSRSPLTAGTATIRGVVTDALTGAPIEGAMVTAAELRRAIQLTATTKADGSYEFAGIVDGGYTMMARTVEHPSLCYGATDLQSACTVVSVVPDQVRSGIDFKLPLGAVVRGVVRDDQRRPLGGILVHAGTPFRDSIRPFNSATTNNRGEFEIHGIPKGQFVLRLNYRAPTGSRQIYYPGVTDANEEISLEAAAGGTVPNADFTIPRFPLYSIRVQPVTASGEGFSDVELSLVSTNPVRVRRTHIAKDGIAAFLRLENGGRYLLSARAQSGSKKLAGWDVVNLVREENEVSMTLRETGRITGRVAADRGGVPPISGARIAAVWTLDGEDVDPLAVDQVELGADGRFTIDGLFGTRRMRLIGLPEEWTIRSVTHGRTEVSASGVDVPPGEAVEVSIVLTRR